MDPYCKVILERRAKAPAMVYPWELGFHPKNTGIKKKGTTFFPGVCHVRFDRRTLPKSGKSIIEGCFVEKKVYGYLIWEKTSRALLGLAKEHNLEQKVREYKRRWNEQYGTTISN